MKELRNSFLRKFPGTSRVRLRKRPRAHESVSKSTFGTLNGEIYSVEYTHPASNLDFNCITNYLISKFLFITYSSIDPSVASSARPPVNCARPDLLHKLHSSLRISMHYAIRFHRVRRHTLHERAPIRALSRTIRLFYEKHRGEPS